MADDDKGGTGKFGTQDPSLHVFVATLPYLEPRYKWTNKVTGVLEKPGIDFTRQEPDKLDPGYGSGERQRKKGTGGGRHRLILLDSAEHTESSVVKGITLVVQAPFHLIFQFIWASHTSGAWTKSMV